MKILLIHPHFPGQFLHLAAFLGRQTQHQVVFLSESGEGELPGVRRVLFRSGLEAKSPHHYVQAAERKLFQGMAVWQAAKKLREAGFVPDVVYGHASWGAMLFAKEAWPEALHLAYCEWFPRSQGQYLDFMGSLGADEQCAVRTDNMAAILSLMELDGCLAPTQWQKAQYPTELQAKMEVIADGVDADLFAPASGTRLGLPEIGLELPAEAEVVTYVARGMEAVRGFAQFSQALALVQRRRPHCHGVIVGRLEPAYDTKHPLDVEAVLAQAGVDRTRVHLTGLLPRPLYRRVLQASQAHVYLTQPFVLSWSFLDALSCGCAVAASRTAPVEEVIRHGENGLLVSFREPAEIAAAVERLLVGDTPVLQLRAQARHTILETYALRKVLPRQLAWMDACRQRKGGA